MFKQIRVSTRKSTIQRNEKKQTRHASALVLMYNDTNLTIWRCSYICTTRTPTRESRKWTRFLFWYLLFVTTRIREHDPYVFLCMSVCLCVCDRVWATCSHHAKQAFLMAVHSLTFGHTSCRYMSSSRWSQDNLTRFLVIILPAQENMHSGAPEVADTARTFLPNRAIHGTIEEARLNSVKGVLVWRHCLQAHPP